jgi:tRNA dimethylallyltransferase
MLDAGFEQEVKNLNKKFGSDCPQLNKMSYGEMQKYLRGELTKDELIKRAEIVDWQLAKKQRTWFRQNHEQITWLPLAQAEKLLNKKLSSCE